MDRQRNYISISLIHKNINHIKHFFPPLEFITCIYFL